MRINVACRRCGATASTTDFQIHKQRCPDCGGRYDPTDEPSREESDFLQLKDAESAAQPQPVSKVSPAPHKNQGFQIPGGRGATIESIYTADNQRSLGRKIKQLLDYRDEDGRPTVDRETVIALANRAAFLASEANSARNYRAAMGVLLSAVDALNADAIRNSDAE